MARREPRTRNQRNRFEAQIPVTRPSGETVEVDEYEYPMLDGGIEISSLLDLAAETVTGTMTENEGPSRGSREWLEEQMRLMMPQPLPDDYHGMPAIPGVHGPQPDPRVVQPLSTFPDPDGPEIFESVQQRVTQIMADRITEDHRRAAFLRALPNIPDPVPDRDRNNELAADIETDLNGERRNDFPTAGREARDSRDGDNTFNAQARQPAAPLNDAERAELAAAIERIRGDMSNTERGQMNEMLGSDASIRATLEALRTAGRPPPSTVRMRLETAPTIARPHRIDLRMETSRDLRMACHRLAVLVDIPNDIVESDLARGFQGLIDALGRQNNVTMNASTRMHLLADALARLEHPGGFEPEPDETEPTIATSEPGRRDMDL